MSGVDLKALALGSRAAVARALNIAESGEHAGEERILGLIDALAPRWDAPGVVVGLTGAPGVGKSTLAGEMIRCWRSDGLRVGMLAVDPSSRGGGALLGDRIRLDHGADPGVFVRSMAARGQHGGLAPGAFAAVLVLRRAFDRVILETVGVGQGELDVSAVADLTLLVLQPGAGDVVQFIKSGIMEEPDIFVLNKADDSPETQRVAGQLAAIADRARPSKPVLRIQASLGEGVAALIGVVAGEIEKLNATAESRRLGQGRAQLVQAFRRRYGAHGVVRAGGRKELAAYAKVAFPARPWSACLEELANRIR